jgi:hypothetical protein
MNALTVPRKAAALEYSLLRLPVQLIESQVVTRFLEDDSALRLGFERALGTLDETAGRLFADEQLVRRGHALRRRSDVLADAARLEEQAAQRKAEADAELRADEQRVAAERKQAEKTRREGVRSATAAERAEKKRVAAQAKAREQAEKRRIEQETRTKVQAATAQADAQEARIDAEERAATAAPKAQLSQATQEKAAADQQRAKAERLEGLVDAEREKREQQREAATTA